MQFFWQISCMIPTLTDLVERRQKKAKINQIRSQFLVCHAIIHNFCPLLQEAKSQSNMFSGFLGENSLGFLMLAWSEKNKSCKVVRLWLDRTSVLAGRGWVTYKERWMWKCAPASIDPRVSCGWQLPNPCARPEQPSPGIPSLPLTPIQYRFIS